MKLSSPILLLSLLLFSCQSSDTKIQQLQTQIDSLRNELANTYKPGFGEFMSGVQVHHAKLWYAGINQNWDLANFEINEIKELKTDIQKYETDRPESKMIPMLEPGLDTVSAAIEHKDPVAFKNSFIVLTNTCNNCHRAVRYPFNDVKIPDTPPFTNQVFQPGKNN